MRIADAGGIYALILIIFDFNHLALLPDWIFKFKGSPDPSPRRILHEAQHHRDMKAEGWIIKLPNGKAFSLKYEIKWLYWYKTLGYDKIPYEIRAKAAEGER